MVMQDYYAAVSTYELKVKDRSVWIRTGCEEARARGHNHGLRATIFEDEELLILEGWAKPQRKYPKPFIHEVYI